jgi:nicotinate-nucleotide--dimethylbenzimidazole phosphoribosyltransferase
LPPELTILKTLRHTETLLMSDFPSSALPFTDILSLLAQMPILDEEAFRAAQLRDAGLVKPPGSLGRLEEFVCWLAGWQGKTMPTLSRPLVCIFAGSHGVTQQGVSAYPASVNRMMLETFAAGGAAISQICAAHQFGFKVFDLAIDLPTPDITLHEAMTEKDCVATMAFGMECLAGGADCLAVGEMGIGNTTIAAAIYAALWGGGAAHWTGRGTGVDDAGLARKIAVIDTALTRHGPVLTCSPQRRPLEILRCLGGREIAAMMGAILAARLQRVPVILDGYVACAAAALLQALDPRALDHCLAGHLSREGAHGEVLERLGLKPILDLGLRLGEGSGAALAMAIVKTALTCHTGMASLVEAGIVQDSAQVAG